MGGLKETHIFFIRHACQMAPRLHCFHSNNMKGFGITVQQYPINDSFGSNHTPSLRPEPVKFVEKGMPLV